MPASLTSMSKVALWRPPALHMPGASSGTCTRKPSQPIAREALERIAALYRIEDMIRGRPPDQRLRIRREHTAPLMAELHDWLKPTLSRIPGRSELAKAIRYTLSRWDGLSLILADGRACMDKISWLSGPCGRSPGRRNWTFAGADAGGERAAAIYSLIETAKINGLDPEDYLRRVIGCIADHPVNRVAQLLPWNLAGIRLRLDQRLAA